MKKALNAAKTANGRSRSCTNCPAKTLNSVCNPANMEICSRAFIEGFQKGAKWYKDTLWHHVSRETPKKNKPLLLVLSNGLLVGGIFEGWGYSFSVPEEFDSVKLDVVKWLYIKDLLH